MKIGGKYRVQELGAREWRKLAAEVKEGGDELLARLSEMARAVPDVVASVEREVRAAGLNHPVVATLGTRLVARSRFCLNQLGG